MMDLLRSQPILLLALIIALGHILGEIRIAGIKLGVAAILFVGLAFGAFDPRLRLPEFVKALGLVVFVYSIGLSSGPAFIQSFRQTGKRDTALVLGLLIVAAAMATVAHHALQLDSTLTVGMYCGSLTNTPALAAVVERIDHTFPGNAEARTHPVIAYSVAYPMGVLGMLLAILVMCRWFRIDVAAETAQLRGYGLGTDTLENRTLRITKLPSEGVRIHDLLVTHTWRVAFGRVENGTSLDIATEETVLRPGDRISLIGTPQEIDRVQLELGEKSPVPLEEDNREFDHREVFVSNQEVLGRPLRELMLPQRTGAIITRIRRGDQELPALSRTTLELGDQVRVVAHRSRMHEVRKFLGDSYRATSEIDLLTFNLGLALGLLLGLIAIPLPGGLTVKLGLAGGPLVVALVLGTLGRTGPLRWNLPASANLTLRQVGIVLFLAGVGSEGGHAFITMIAGPEGVLLFCSGAVITTSIGILFLWIGYRLLKIPFVLLMGMLAGFQTQPALLGFATMQTGNDVPNIGYSAVYPAATIGKIMIVQILLQILT